MEISETKKEVIGMIFRVLRSFNAHMENFTSKLVYEVMEMNFTNVKEVFVLCCVIEKNIFQFCKIHLHHFRN